MQNKSRLWARNASANGIRMTTGLATDLAAGLCDHQWHGPRNRYGSAQRQPCNRHSCCCWWRVTLSIHPKTTTCTTPFDQPGVLLSAKCPLASNPSPKASHGENRIIAGLSYGTVVVEALPQRQSDYGTFGDRVWAGSHGRSWLTVG